MKQISAPDRKSGRDVKPTASVTPVGNRPRRCYQGRDRRLAAAQQREHGWIAACHSGCSTTTAALLEDTAVAAYNGQAANLTKPVLKAAATIVSVEARHAAWIRDIVGEPASPQATDTPATERQVRRAIARTGFVKAGGNKLASYSSPFYGPVAFGTSARSEVLTDWPAGGFVGIHGTNRPELLPGRVSHRCFRMRNQDIVRLARLLPVGTPLTVH